MNFGGGIRLDGNLDLAGKILLQPSTVSSLTQGKVTPSDPIPVGLKLRGPAWKPMPTDLDLKEALAVIAKQGAGAALGRFFKSRGGADGAAVPKAPQRPADAVGEQADKAQQEAQDKAKKFLKGFGR
jgi:AsmA protein